VLRRWHAAESDASARIWWRDGKNSDFVTFDRSSARVLRERFRANNREHVID
jgi:hypothetical protein